MSFNSVILGLRERWYGPLLLTVALLIALGGLLFLLEQGNSRALKDRLEARTTLALQGMELQLSADRDFLLLLAQGMTRGMIDIPKFQERVVNYVKAHPDLQAIAWLDANLEVHWVGWPDPDREKQGWTGGLPEPLRALAEARDLREPRYSNPFLTSDNTPAILLAVPIFSEDRFLGALEALYPLEDLLLQDLPQGLLQSYRVCLEDLSGGVASVCSTQRGGRIELAEIFPLSFLGDKVQVRVSPFVQEQGYQVRLLILAAVALSLGLGWGMWVLQRDMQIRKRTEYDLNHHLTLLQTILSATPDSVSVKDLTGRFRLINRAGAEWLGQNTHEMAGRTIQEFLETPHAESVVSKDRAVLERGIASTCEEILDAGGAQRYLLTTRTPFKDEQGKIAGLVVVSRDVSNLKTTELELRSSEQRFRSIFESAALGIALLNEEGQLVQVNDQFRHFLGYSSDELVGMSIRDITSPEDWGESQKAIAQHLDSGEKLILEKRYRRKDGQDIWGLVSSTLIPDTTGQSMMRVALVQDIDDRKRAETALRQSEERYRMLFSAGSDPIVVFDAESGDLIEANDAAVELFGYPLKELRAMSIINLFAENPTGQAKPLNLLSSKLRRVPLLQVQRMDGSTVPVEMTAGRFVWQGRPLTVAILRDITERQELERMKDDMLSSVSHEMRTPLTAMLGFVEYLLDNEVSKEEQNDYLRIVVKETLRLKELIDNLLNLQRLRAGVTPLRVDQISIEAMFHDVIALFATSATKHHFQIDCPEHLPAIAGDETQIFQAIRNLVSNAVKYSPEGGEVVLGARKEQDKLHIWVRDEGLGIPQSALDRIFERFFRVSSNGHQKIGGTGLGLPLVKEIIQRHGGEIWAECNDTKGSTFHFQLPFVSPRSTGLSQTVNE